MHSLAAEKKNSEGKEDRRINGIRRGEREKKATVSFSNPITTLNTVFVVCTTYVMVPAVSMDPGSVPYSSWYKKKG